MSLSLNLTNALLPPRPKRVASKNNKSLECTSSKRKGIGYEFVTPSVVVRRPYISEEEQKWWSMKAWAAMSATDRTLEMQRLENSLMATLNRLTGAHAGRHHNTIVWER